MKRYNILNKSKQTRSMCLLDFNTNATHWPATRCRTLRLDVVSGVQPVPTYWQNIDFRRTRFVVETLLVLFEEA